MRLTKFKNINTASFDNFNWNSEVSNFKDINIILGWNGTGKTVISRILRAFEFGENVNLPDDSKYELQFDKISLNQNQLKGNTDKIKVFNEDYIKEITEIGNLPHVFYLGEEAVDFSGKEKEIKFLNSKLKSCTDEYSIIAENVARNIKSLAGISNLSKELQSGVYNNFDKRGFEIRINDIESKITTENAKLLDFQLDSGKLKVLQTQLAQQSDKKREFTILSDIDKWITSNYEKLEGLLKQIVEFFPSKRVNNYSKDSVEYNWIKKGVSIHKLNEEEHIKTCIFCTNTIENQNELVKHFTNDVLELNGKIEIFQKEIRLFQGKMEQSEFTFYIEESKYLIEFLSNLFSLLEAKKTKTNKEEFIDSYNSLEGENDKNDIFNKIANQLEKHYISEVFLEYKKKKESFDTCNLEQNSIKDSLLKSKQELIELKAKAKNSHHPAEKLNKLIKVTFPFKNIEIKDSEDGVGYSLYRNNSPCGFDTLSEGERNFIALAYFLISLNSEGEENSLLKDGIVLIDDPVSSLDKNSIFQIFSIISYEMEINTERQYFILTHNLEFFSHLHDHYQAKISDDKVKLYQVNLNKEGSSISHINGLLKNFKSDYLYSVKLLWGNRENCSLENSYLVINLLRRVWETFLHFKFSSSGDFRSLLEKAYIESINIKLGKVGSAPEERKEEIKSEFRSNYISMYRFVNYGSHEFGSVDTIDESILLASSERIKNFFTIVELLDKHHYKKITSSSD